MKILSKVFADNSKSVTAVLDNGESIIVSIGKSPLGKIFFTTLIKNILYTNDVVPIQYLDVYHSLSGQLLDC